MGLKGTMARRCNQQPRPNSLAFAPGLLAHAFGRQLRPEFLVPGKAAIAVCIFTCARAAQHNDAQLWITGSTGEVFELPSVIKLIASRKVHAWYR